MMTTIDDNDDDNIKYFFIEPATSSRPLPNIQISFHETMFEPSFDPGWHFIYLGRNAFL